MPADIRAFFANGQTAPKKSARSTPAPRKAGRASRVIDDSDSDGPDIVKNSSSKEPAKRNQRTERDPTPDPEETTTSAFFASSNKPKRPGQAVRAKMTPVKAHAHASTTTTPTRTSTRAKKSVISYAEEHSTHGHFLDDDIDGADDILGEKYKPQDEDEYSEKADSDAGPPIRLPQRGTHNTLTSHRKNARDKDDGSMTDGSSIMGDVDAEKHKMPQSATHGSDASRKRKSLELDEDLDDDVDGEEIANVESKRNKTRKSASTKSPAKKRLKQEDTSEDSAIQAIYDSIPTVRAPTPPRQDTNAKFNWRANAGRAEPPPLQGSSGDMPSGSETCLAGLTFVFTGVLQRWGRTEAQELVKRHGGKITGAPSKKTSYVVLGTDAGPSKLGKIKSMNIKTIDEDGLTQLIERLTAAGSHGDSKAQAAHKEKQRKEEEKIRQQAAEIEEEELRLAKERLAKGATAISDQHAHSSVTGKQNVSSTVDSRLWTTKYAPTTLGQICGNKATVEKLQRWLQRFPKNVKTGFKLAGADGSGSFRAVMLHGPPGIGKTTAAHLVAGLEGYDIVERNASDTRSKKLIEDGLRGVLSTNSLHGYFASDGERINTSKRKLVLIMDEVDGMSAGDRGGVGALAAVCKKTEVPMILICNDRRLPKMKPFDYVTYDLPFRRPTVDQIRSRIMTIAFREGLKIPAPVINALIEGSHADIRQVVNMISTAKLDQAAMDYDSGKQMSKNWEKHVVLKPWDITQKILGGGLFAASSKTTLNEKIELYFNDHEFSPLMLQENYLGTNATLASSFSGKEKNLKALELASKAAESISDGDLVDRMIHGSQQQWSLMPSHAVLSFVRPASFVAGSTAGHQTRFTAWLGKNSSMNKFSRLVKEIQAHMRLRSSGDRHEVRQHYMPVLWAQLVQKLQVSGKEAVPDIIDVMDSYFLTKEDFDAIMELGVGYMDQEKVKIDSQAKATFTRLYNQQSHPLPFMKASSVTAPKKQTREKPDLEEALEESDDGDVVDDAKELDEETDLSKDKYVKQPKKKAAAKNGASARKNGKKTAKDDDQQNTASGEHAPKGEGKGRSKGQASTKAKKK